MIIKKVSVLKYVTTPLSFPPDTIFRKLFAANMSGVPRPKAFSEAALSEVKLYRTAASKVNAEWIAKMRYAKVSQLKQEAQVLSQDHARDIDRKDLLMQMYLRDLDEATDENQVATMAILKDMNSLINAYESTSKELINQFERQVTKAELDHSKEMQELQTVFSRETTQLKILISEIDKVQQMKLEADLLEHQTQTETVHGQNLEEDHQVRASLEDRIEKLKDRCNAQLTSYKQSTEQSAQDYKDHLSKDTEMAAEVDSKLKDVEKTLAEIADINLKISTSKRDWSRKNSKLKLQRDLMAKNYTDSKLAITKHSESEYERMVDLTNNANACQKTLAKQLEMMDRVLRLQDLCRKYETQRERVAPFLAPADFASFEDLPFPSEQAREAARTAFENERVDPDEWSYLDGFFQRYNKVQLDTAGIELTKAKLLQENTELKSALKQFLSGVSTPGATSAVNPKFNPGLTILRSQRGK